MRTDQFDFTLPADRIALRPVQPRETARLLVVKPGGNPEFTDHIVRDLPELLRAGDTLVVNDTKVISAALRGRRIGAGVESRIDVNLHKRIDGSRWRAFVRPARRLRVEDRVRFGEEGRVCLLGELDARVEEKGEGGEVTFAFDLSGAALDEAIEAVGAMPIPPYIATRRAADEKDRADYQTIFARAEGSVAAPTAGLHFSDELIARIEARGISFVNVTLHVGAGTFLPVKAEDTREHRMHAEIGEITPQAAARLSDAPSHGGRIVAVGTTSLRLLESAASEGGKVRPFCGETAIFLTPGHRFRTADALVTNFHLPRSTLFMLVAAFSGLDRMKRAYAHAIEAGYRFYSYGDACLLFREQS